MYQVLHMVMLLMIQVVRDFMIAYAMPLSLVLLCVLKTRFNITTRTNRDNWIHARRWHRKGMADERRKSRKPMGFHGKTLAKTLVRTSFGSHLMVLEQEY